ncbi:MAG: GntR family transcriptional regulator [Ruminococcaceae bacterium]|nr:GntR family transcriptional regulator [Oscillospiraceae bacterium]
MTYSKDTNLSVAAPIDSQTVSDKVYLSIKNAIINGKFKPGERIIQEDLTKQMNVSRTPVRDALQRLNSEGLVVITPFHGAMVFELSKKSLSEIYEIRAVLEDLAAQKAIERITDTEIEQLQHWNTLLQTNQADLQKCMFYDRSFHRDLCAMAHAQNIIDILQGIWDKCDPYKSIYYAQHANMERTLFEHDQIIKAFKIKDKKLLSTAIHDHLDDVVDMISHNSNILE